MFAKQFIDRTFWVTLGAIVATHLLAVFVRETPFELVALLAIIAVSAVLTWKNTTSCLLIAFAEIFVGGHGHLLDANVGPLPISLRLAVFAGVMAGWGLRTLKDRAWTIWRFELLRDVPWILLAAAIALGTFIGFTSNDPAKAFDDMNGFMTIAYLLPIISIAWSQKLRRQLLEVFASSVTWIVFLTLALSFFFSHVPGKIANPVYTFVRDARIAEVTLQVYETSYLGDTPYFYRVFMPSQLFAVIALILALSAAFLLWRGQRMHELNSAAIVGTTATGILSMSRSFAVGFLPAALLVWGWSFLLGKKAIRSVLLRSVVVAILAGAGGLLAYATIAIPIPTRPDLTEATFYKTSSEVGREAGVSSRWKLLPPLMAEVWSSPFLGSGFGEEVTYGSDDPRIIAETGGGEYTTYRFEWGYQDLWLKMGVLGLIAFVAYAICTGRAVVHTIKTKGHDWLTLGLAGGVIVVFAAHIFSPYLNHPIGLGYLLFVIPFLDYPQTKKYWITLPQSSTLDVFVPAQKGLAVHGSSTLGLELENIERE